MTFLLVYEAHMITHNHNWTEMALYHFVPVYIFSSESSVDNKFSTYKTSCKLIEMAIKAVK